MDSPVRAAPYLHLSGVQKTFGDGDGATVALGHIDLDVKEGEFLAVVGPSGCGKSTLLQIAAGLALPSAGAVTFQGRDVQQEHVDICHATVERRADDACRLLRSHIERTGANVLRVLIDRQTEAAPA